MSLGRANAVSDCVQEQDYLASIHATITSSPHTCCRVETRKSIASNAHDIGEQAVHKSSS